MCIAAPSVSILANRPPTLDSALFKLLAFVIAFAAAPLALANTPVAAEAGDFAAQRATIERALADGKTYAEISSADRSEVRSSLDRMSALLEGGKTADSLSEAEKVELFNAQETVNTLLTRAASDSRVVCTRVEVTGSHRKQSRCTTVAERDRRRQLDQDRLQNSQKVILQQGG